MSRWILVAVAAVALTATALFLLGRDGGLDGGSPSSSSSGDGVAPAWFSPKSVWNARLSDDAPRARNSDQIAGTLSREIARERKDRSGPWLNTTQYGVALYTVSKQQPAVPVQVDDPNATLRSAMSRIPIPDDAKPARGADGHLVVWQPSTDTMWELYRAKRAGAGWTAAYGGTMRDVSRSRGAYTDREADGKVIEQEGWGATATSLPLLGGLITPTDLERDSIDHALALGVPDLSSKFVAPARRTDGRSSDPAAIPAGARFRLPADLDLDDLELSEFGRQVAEAAQRYGIVVRDTAGNVTFYGQSNSNAYRDALEGAMPVDALDGFPWDRLEVVEPT